MKLIDLQELRQQSPPYKFFLFSKSVGHDDILRGLGDHVAKGGKEAGRNEGLGHWEVQAPVSRRTVTML